MHFQFSNKIVRTHHPCDESAESVTTQKITERITPDINDKPTIVLPFAKAIIPRTIDIKLNPITVYTKCINSAFRKTISFRKYAETFIKTPTAPLNKAILR
jgi:hypothetical protein